jgi:hypothetical protein
MNQPKECKPQGEHQVPEFPLVASISNKEKGRPLERMPNLDDSSQNNKSQNRNHMCTLL